MSLSSTLLPCHHANWIHVFKWTVGAAERASGSIDSRRLCIKQCGISSVHQCNVYINIRTLLVTGQKCYQSQDVWIIISLCVDSRLVQPPGYLVSNQNEEFIWLAKYMNKERFIVWSSVLRAFFLSPVERLCSIASVTVGNTSMLLERSTGQDISSSGTSYSMQKDRIVTDAEKRAVRKLDYTVIPVMTMFSFCRSWYSWFLVIILHWITCWFFSYLGSLQYW